MEYFTRLQTLADTLRDCDMGVTDRGLVSNMLRGLSNKFSHAISTMTYDETKLPTFLQARSYLLQEERRIDRAAAHEPATALHAAARAPAAPAPTACPHRLPPLPPPAPPTAVTVAASTARVATAAPAVQAAPLVMARLPALAGLADLLPPSSPTPAPLPVPARALRRPGTSGSTPGPALSKPGP
ncbi:hypothetical protein ACQJBY_006126 [Aegilops geniculata]